MTVWTEKYRPKILKEVVGQETNITRLQNMVDKKSLTHCIFAGPAGTGKTTSALAIAHELYGDNWKNNFLELNSSDERGIDTIRTKVKDFARTVPLGDHSFKIIYLDEADSLTKDAQHALRRTMEKYSDNARFILACNWFSKLIPPIQSRAAIFRFSPVPLVQMKENLKKIAFSEKVSVDDKALETIVYLAEGDLRKAINTLQTASLHATTSITEKTIHEVTSTADPAQVKNMIQFSLEGKFEDARNILLNLIVEQGLSGEDIIKEVHKQIFNLNIENNKKINMLAKVGDYEFRLSEGSNPLVQLEAMLAQFGLARVA